MKIRMNKESLKKSRYTPWRRLGGEEVWLLLIHNLGTRWGEWSASRPGRALSRGKDPRYPLDRRLGGPQSRSGFKLNTPYVLYNVLCILYVLLCMIPISGDSCDDNPSIIIYFNAVPLFLAVTMEMVSENL